MLYVTGIAMTRRSSGSVITWPMVVQFYLGQYVAGGIYFGITWNHWLSLYLPALGSVAFGFGAMIASASRLRLKTTTAIKEDVSGHIVWPSYAIATGLTGAFSVGAVALLLALRGTPLSGTVSKIDVAAGLGPLMRISTTGLPLTAVFLLLLKERLSRRWVNLVLVLFILLASAQLTLLGYKGFVFDMVLLLILSMAYIQRGKVSKKAVTILVILAVVSALGVLYLQPGPSHSSFGMAVKMLVKRFSIDAALGLDYLIYSYPPSYRYGGETLVWDFTSAISEITQGTVFSNDQVVFTRLLHNQFFNSTSRYALTIGLVGDMYANFGIVGVVVGMFLFGIVMNAIHSCIQTQHSEALFWPLPLWTAFTLAQASSTGSVMWAVVSRLFSFALVYVPFLVTYVFLSLPLQQRKLTESIV